MSAQQIDAWKNLIMGLIPTAIMLVAAIMVLRKHRAWYTWVLVATAAVGILLPVLSQIIVSDVMTLAEQIKAMPAQQQQDAATKLKPNLESYNYRLKWLGDGRYMASMIFAIALFFTVTALLPREKAQPSQPVAAEQTPSDDSKAS